MSNNVTFWGQLYEPTKQTKAIVTHVKQPLTLGNKQIFMKYSQTLI